MATTVCSATRAHDANIPAMNRARPETPSYLAASWGGSSIAVPWGDSPRSARAPMVAYSRAGRSSAKPAGAPCPGAFVPVARAPDSPAQRVKTAAAEESSSSAYDPHPRAAVTALAPAAAGRPACRDPGTGRASVEADHTGTAYSPPLICRLSEAVSERCPRRRSAAPVSERFASPPGVACLLWVPRAIC